MSMEHKAFVFDTEKFHAEIEPVMKDSIKNAEVAHRYICEHLDELQSPYMGDELGEDWEEEFGELTLRHAPYHLLRCGRQSRSGRNVGCSERGNQKSRCV